MECPVCLEGMVIIEYKSIELDYCVGCMGIWFDRGEIELLFEKAGIPLPADALRFTNAQPVNRELSRPCPLCRKAMRKVSLEGSDVVLDQCPENDGLWFDAGEIGDTVRDVAGRSGSHVLTVLREFLGEAVSLEEK